VNPVMQAWWKPVRVDIGTPVKAGDLLAHISVPEYQKQVDRDAARVTAAEAKVRQMEAHQTAAEAEAKATATAGDLAKALVRAKSSYRKYREKQLARIKELADQNGIDRRTVDEQEDFYLSALEAENAAKVAVSEAEQRATAAAAKITQAKADLDEA